ncbi:MAG: UDP-N-acetylmuramoyl-L-alanine--D-glutamate ligase [Verrucomicrobiota bacterium]
MRYRGQQIAVLGAGKSGIAAARLARREGAEVCVRDTGEGSALAETAAMLEGEGIGMMVGEAALAEAGGCDLAVISPGVDHRSALAGVFLGAGVGVIGEIEFADRHMDCPVVAITGTNGKTTTTELVAEVLNGCGQRTVAAGNYGLAYSDVVLSGESYDVVTLEVSSFQLEGIVDFRPSVSVWLNFAPDHLDRYAGVEEYREAKLRIFENQTEEDSAVVNYRDGLGDLKARTITFSAFTTGADFVFEDGRIVYGGEAVCDFGATRLRGTHNAENLMAALAVGRLRDLSWDAMSEAVRAYTPPPHRCELAATIGGREYINDSKATNLHALEQSLLSQGEPVVLIVGGKDKGLPFGEIADTVAGRATAVVAIGEIRDEIVREWSGSVSCEAAEGMEAAVRMATAAAAPGQSILFSPGTSSFDMFSGYEERGECFKGVLTKL